jgi:hypothetical protein
MHNNHLIIINWLFSCLQNVHSACFACKKKTKKTEMGENYLAVALLSRWTAAVLWWQEVFPATERKRPKRCYNVYLLPCLSFVFRLSSLLSFHSLALCFFCFVLAAVVLVVAHGASGGGKLGKAESGRWTFFLFVFLALCFCSPIALASVAPSSVSDDGGAVVGGVAGDKA